MEYETVNISVGKKGHYNMIETMIEEVWHKGKFPNRSEAVRWCIAAGFSQLGCQLPDLPDGVIWGDPLPAEPQEA